MNDSPNRAGGFPSADAGLLAILGGGPVEDPASDPTNESATDDAAIADACAMSLATLLGEALESKRTARESLLRTIRRELALDGESARGIETRGLRVTPCSAQGAASSGRLGDLLDHLPDYKADSTDSTSGLRLNAGGFKA